MSAPAFIAFYYVTAIESWTYINIIEYYRAKIEQKDLKQILDRVKKDLQVVANPNSDFDMRQQVLATRDNMIHNIDNSCTTLRNHQDVDNIEEIMDTKSAKTLMMKKKNAGENYIIEGVKVLNEARFSSSVKEYYSLDLYPIDGENDGNEIDDKGDELLELNVFTDFTTVDKWNLTENKAVNEIF
ncbi:19980_t:CDS:2 [Entrophospora sp. SA101]|nr:19980_t:CDS:2 [Entrophospora sp. SA101]